MPGGAVAEQIDDAGFLIGANDVFTGTIARFFAACGKGLQG